MTEARLPQVFIMQLPLHIDDWPQFWRERYEERAAIREYDGNESRATAERNAAWEVRQEASQEGELFK